MTENPIGLTRKVIKPVSNFFSSPVAGGIVLIIASAAAIIVANSPLREGYETLLKYKTAGLSVEHWINDALMAVNQAGTGRRVFLGAPYTSAGKTGTAQAVAWGQNTKYNARLLEEHKRDHSLFAAFAPVEDPKVAVAVIVENAGFGAAAAAPIVRRVFDYWLLGQYPNEQDMAAVRAGKAAAPIGQPLPATEVALPSSAASAANAAIDRHPRDRLRMAVREDGKDAVTHFRLRERFRAHTALECRLETGRTHQIRVHAQHIGHPVAGASFEGLAIETLVHSLPAGSRAWFYRTHEGAEIDLLIERGGQPQMAIEIKRSSAPSLERGFGQACQDLSVQQRWVVYPGTERFPLRHGAQGYRVIDGLITGRLNQLHGRFRGQAVIDIAQQ